MWTEEGDSSPEEFLVTGPKGTSEERSPEVEPASTSFQNAVRNRWSCGVAWSEGSAINWMIRES